MQAVGSVPTRKVSLGKCGSTTDPSVVMPVAGDTDGWKLSPPSVETIILISLPLPQIMKISPLAATLISGAKEPPVTILLPAGVTPAPAPTQLAPWSFVRAKSISDPLSQTT